MAIIIKCRQCKTRLESDKDPCPARGSMERAFILDYMFDGRHSKRIRQFLPPGVTSLAEAHKIEEIRNNLKKKKTKIIVPDGATVKDLFPQYLTCCKDHRSITTHNDINQIYKAHYICIMGDEIVSQITEANFKYYQAARMADIKRNSEGPVKNRTINTDVSY